MIRRLRHLPWLLLLCIMCQWMAPSRMMPIASALAAAPGVSCTATMTSINFGNVDPNTYGRGRGARSTNYNLETTGFLTYYCTNTAATVQTITACFSIGNPGGNVPRAMNGPGGSTMTYDLYQDAAGTTPWGSRYLTTWGNPYSATVTMPANANSSPITVPIYAIIDSFQGSNSGSYSANYSDNDVALDTISGANMNCAGASTGGNKFTFSVIAAVAQTCQVTTNPLTFPTPAGGDPSGVTATTTLTVTCTNHTGYEVGLDNGKNWDGSSRRMRGGPTHSDYVGYGLYQDSNNTVPWGNTPGNNGNTVTGTSSTENFTVYGQVNTSQGMPAGGDYFDAITVYVYY